MMARTIRYFFALFFVMGIGHASLFGQISISNASGTDPNCSGGSDGSISFDVSAFTGPAFSYTVNGGSSVFSTSNSNTLSSLAAGSYSLIVTDTSSGGTTATTTVILTDPPDLHVFANGNTDVLCKGDSTGSLDVLVQGGTGPYSVSLTDNTNATVSTLSVAGTVASFQNLSAGTYMIHVLDANGCQFDNPGMVNIGEPAVGVQIQVLQQTNIPCQSVGNSQGMIVVGGSGGTAPYTFSDDGTNFGTTDTFFFGTGPHTIFVRDANLCQSDTNVTISQSGGPQTSISSQLDVLCNGGNTGSVDIGVTAGTVPYEYALLSAPTNFGSNSLFINLPAGSNSVIVKDQSGCRDTIAFTIAEPAPISFQSVSVADNTSCSAPNGAITVNTTGGTGTVDITLAAMTLQNSGTFNNLAAGSYVINLQDANGCTTDSINTVGSTVAIPALDFLILDTISCFGANDGQAGIVAKDGAPPYTIRVDAITLTGTFQPGDTAFASNLQPLSHNFEIIDNLGCQTNGSFNIVEPLPLAVSASVTDVLCFGEATGVIVLTGQGGTPPYLYGLNGAFQSADSFTNRMAGSYTVAIRDNRLCTDTAIVVVTQPPAASKAEFVQLEDNYCLYPDTVLIPLLASPAGGIFSLNNAGNNALNATGDTLILTELTSTLELTYSVFILGCNIDTTRQVTVGAKPDFMFDLAVPNVACNSSALELIISLNDSFHSQIQSGIFFGPGLQQSSKDTARFYPGLAGAGNHLISYAVTDTAGCSQVMSDTIRVHQLPLPQFAVDNPCATEVTTFLDQSSDPGGSGIKRKTWRFGDLLHPDSTLSDLAASVEYGYSFPGNYNVVLTLEDNNACVDSSTVTILVGSVPEVQFDFDKICFGDQTEFRNRTEISSLVTGGGIDWTWHFGDGSTDTTFDAIHLFTGDPDSFLVSLVAITRAGCKDSLSRDLVILPNLVVDASNEYHEDFDRGNSSWFASELSSWIQDTAISIRAMDKSSAQSPDGKYWLLHDGILAYKEGESSWVNSPCFDLTPLERPMIELDIWSYLNSTEGVVLQARVENESPAKWEAVGYFVNGKSSGINWYNASGINGEPGGQVDNRYGWSLENVKGFNARHRLDSLVRRARKLSDSKIRFRVALGSRVAPDVEDGFAFDHVRIRNRSKAVLLEHFTCLDCPDSTAATAAANQQVYDVAQSDFSDIIPVQYDILSEGSCFHASFPKPGNSRTVFYGLGEINQTILNGDFVGSVNSLSLTRRDLELLSLEGPRFVLEEDSLFRPGPMAFPNQLKLRIAAKGSFSGELVVHVAYLLDRLPAGGVLGCAPNLPIRFQTVAMLPDPGGSFLNRSWLDGDIEELSIDLSAGSGIRLADSLATLVYFIQDADTREVYQAGWQPLFPSTFTILTTALDPVLEESLAWTLYPNPTAGEFNLRFAEPIADPLQWQLMDLSGRILDAGELSRGTLQTGIRPARIARGLYFVRIMQGGYLIETRKLMVE